MPTDRHVPNYSSGDEDDDDIPTGDAAGDPIEREPSFKSAGTVGMILFLAALFMLFTASLLGFVWTRYGSPKSPPAGAIHLPNELWLSTVLVICVSVALGLAGRKLREGKQRSARNSLTAALALAAGFLTVQAPALVKLVQTHENLRATGMHLYGLIFFLVLLHALHVVGGMVALVVVTIKAHRGGYDRRFKQSPIRMTALYWHFLDAVWIVMFSLLFVMR
jgi:heme/copper-type cytochrome/quinol oxidase subunit 3